MLLCMFLVSSAAINKMYWTIQALKNIEIIDTRKILAELKIGFYEERTVALKKFFINYIIMKKATAVTNDSILSTII
jgi:hypothetical protein